jgi:hypothetical protein
VAYTVGDIGSHRCVVTKLPMTGHSREASIASGSSTTRLLGTFQVSALLIIVFFTSLFILPHLYLQAVEHVFIVGVGGGVPHYTDYARHVRLGDVVLAAPNRACVLNIAASSLFQILTKIITYISEHLWQP